MLNTSFWKNVTENGSSRIFTYFENLCFKDLKILLCILVLICLFLNVFQ